MFLDDSLLEQFPDDSLSNNTVTLVYELENRATPISITMIFLTYKTIARLILMQRRRMQTAMVSGMPAILI